MNLDIDDLKESKTFLNDLYANVTTAIFLADEDTRLVHFNDAFKALFYKPEDKLLGEFCGNALGCSFISDEAMDCGSTSNCERCELRSSILKSLTEHVPVYKMLLVRDFDICGIRMRKHFSITTKYATYLGEEYVLVLVDDVTELAEARTELVRKNEALQAALHSLTQELIDNSRELALIKENSQGLCKELRHRVGNTLQMLSSLLEFETTEDAIKTSAFNDFMRRLDTIIEAYRQTRYEEGDVRIPLESFIRTLTEKVESCSYPSIDTTQSGQQLITLEIAIPLGLAMVELIAFARRRTTRTITVESNSENHILTIGIKTLAPCFGPFDQSAHVHVKDTGLTNIKLASAMIEQLKGKLEFHLSCEAWIGLPIK